MYVFTRSLSAMTLCLTLCNAVDLAHQALLAVVFSRQEYRGGLPFPPSGNLPAPGIEPRSPVSLAWQAGSSPAEPFCQHYAIGTLAASNIIGKQTEATCCSHQSPWFELKYCSWVCSILELAFIHDRKEGGIWRELDSELSPEPCYSH